MIKKPKLKKLGYWDKEAVDSVSKDDLTSIGSHVLTNALYVSPFLVVASVLENNLFSIGVFTGFVTYLILDCTRPMRDGYLLFPPLKVDKLPDTTHPTNEPCETTPKGGEPSETTLQVEPIQDTFSRYEKVFSAYNVKAQIEYLDTYDSQLEPYKGKLLDTFVLKVQVGYDINKLTKYGENLSRDLGLKDGEYVSVNPNIGDGRSALYVPKNKRLPVIFNPDNPNWLAFSNSAELPFYFGEYVDGSDAMFDIEKTVHLLVGGQTRSGKSVTIRTIVDSMMLARTPEQLRITFHDPKRVELVKYTGMLHTNGQVTVNIEPFINVLQALELKMDARYKEFAKHKVVNIKEYNKKNPDNIIPYEVLVVEEVTSVICASDIIKEVDESGKTVVRKLAKEAESLLTDIARLGAGAGFFMILGVQRFDSKTFQGQLRDNIPSVIGLTVKTHSASDVLIDQSGCEKLMRYGDALILTTGEVKPKRAHGAIWEKEVPTNIFKHQQKENL